LFNTAESIFQQSHALVACRLPVCGTPSGEGVPLEAFEFARVSAINISQRRWFQRISLLISLLAGNSAVETSSTTTASATKQQLRDHAGEKRGAPIGQCRALSSGFNRWWLIAGDRHVIELRD
jgi:hypothetical protein